jgi:Amino acid kinase family
VVVAVGDGGVPVVRQADARRWGVEAVVDKDLASALVAADIGAEVLMILTGVEHVAVDFGRPIQRDLQEATTVELAAYARQGHFAPGSMLPRVRAVLRFLEGGGRRAVITTPELSERRSPAKPAPRSCRKSVAFRPARRRPRPGTARRPERPATYVVSRPMPREATPSASDAMPA